MSRLLSHTLLSLLIAIACGCGGRAPTPEGVLLISVDTLRADHLGVYGADPERGLSVALDALAGESLVFERAYAPAPFTRPSVASLLTGREPARVGVVSNVSPLAREVPTLASAFAARGFATGAVVSNPVLGEGSGLARDFDHYDAPALAAGAPDRTASATTEAALAVLEQLRAVHAEGWFLWVHYQDPHGPYTPPPPHRDRQLVFERTRADAQRELVVSRSESGHGGIPNYQAVDDHRAPAYYRAGYAGEVGYTDAAIGRLLAAVDADPDAAPSVVVFTADHGEGLGEGDYWFAHGEHLGEELVRVPLLLRVVGRAPERRRDVAALADVATTLADRFDLDLPTAGRSLLAPDAAERGSDVFLSTLAYVQPPRFAVVSGELRYTAEAVDGVVRERLLRGDRDVAAAEPERLRALRAIVRTRIRELEAMPPPDTQALDEEERRALRALGYVTD